MSKFRINLCCHRGFFSAFFFFFHVCGGLATRSAFLFFSIGESVTGTRFLLGSSSVERGTAFHGYNFRYFSRRPAIFRFLTLPVRTQALFLKGPTRDNVENLGL